MWNGDLLKKFLRRRLYSLSLQTFYFLKQALFWGVHSLVWLCFNVFLGSLPFVVTLFRYQNDDPFLVGLLCFCFTSLGAGLYSNIACSFKGEQSGFAKAGYSLLFAITVVWMFLLWTIVFNIPDIVKFMDKINISLDTGSLLFIYIFSVFLFFIANLAVLSSLVRDHMAKNLIMEPVNNSQADGNSMKKALRSEEEF